MKLYVDIGGTAPSPRRVRMYLAEKGLEVPYVYLKLHEENRDEAFREKNPIGTLPVLELDDGTCISESMAICRYFEAQYPEPSLLGATPKQIAVIEMWTRRAELYLYEQIDYAGFLEGELESPIAAARFRSHAQLASAFLNRIFNEREFLASDEFSMADIFAYGALDFGRRFANFTPPENLEHLARWFEAIAARPSARA